MENPTVDYAHLALTWNECEMEPWSIRSIYSSFDGTCIIVVQRKELRYELLDWFDDMRVGVVVYGDKILSHDDFWHVLYKKAIPKLQQLFKPVLVRITERPTVPCATLLWGSKVHVQVSIKEELVPVANRGKLRYFRKH